MGPQSHQSVVALAEFQKWLGTMKEGPLFQRIEVSYLGDTQ